MRVSTIAKIEKQNDKSYHITINKKEWEIAERWAGKFWSSKKSGKYGKGILTSDKDKTRSLRTGLLGEIAFARLMGFRLNFKYSEGGEAHDFILKDGRSADIKTASRNYGAVCIKAIHENGAPCKIKSDLYIVGYIVLDDIVKKKSVVCLKGWLSKEELLNLPVVNPRACGSWKNREISFDCVHPLEALSFLRE